MNQYLHFVPMVHDDAEHYEIGFRASGLLATTGYAGGKPGYWVSAPADSPPTPDWWRSRCGHTVGKAEACCPVCGEEQPK